MKYMHATLLLLSISSSAVAQNSIEQNSEQIALAKLNFLVGNWAGQGISYDAQGAETLYHDTEFVRYDLNGELLLINARGYRDGKTTYQLHTVIYFDAKLGRYIYAPYTAKGARPFQCDLRQKQFICYTQNQDFRLIFQRLPNGIWNEYGERKTQDGWRKTFETKLSAVP